MTPSVPRDDLTGRVVAITGAARGIGLATARACVRAGMRTAVGDIDGDASRRAASTLAPDAIGLPVDVSDRASFAAFLDRVEDRLGPLDVLVNNAGVFSGGPFADEDPARTEQVMAVNVLGVMHGSQLALERFRARGSGHLVNVASSGGLIAVPGCATYTASKHAVVGFTRALRQELHGSPIRTTVVCPGHVATDMTASFARLRGVRVLHPDDIGESIVGALRSGRDEVVLPGEMRAVVGALGLLSPAMNDTVKRLAGMGRLVPADAGRTG